jgi:ABC-type dipeptide/oligopeptide/nickel transport system permease component
MKTFFPKHIDGWRLNISFQIGPFRITMIQLLVIALGTSLALGLRNQMVKQWINKWVALAAVLPIFVIFIVIAFFKVSELSLIPFMAKVIQTHILDESKKFQINSAPIDPIDIGIAKSKLNEPETNRFDQKTIHIDDLEIAKEKNILG